MTQNEIKEKMQELFGLVVEHQIKVLKDGEATSADISNNLKIFKDNFITFEKEEEKKIDKQEEYLNSLRIELQQDTNDDIQVITLKKREKLQEYIQTEEVIKEDLEDFIEGVLNNE